MLPLDRYVAVMLGGAFGSVLRYAITVAVVSRYPSRFPVATFGINVLGSFLIGVAYTAIPDTASPLLRPLLIAGMLGGFTTFSAFEWEAYTATRAVALVYVIASVGFGFAACWSGANLGRVWGR